MKKIGTELAARKILVRNKQTRRNLEMFIRENPNSYYMGYYVGPNFCGKKNYDENENTKDVVWIKRGYGDDPIWIEQSIYNREVRSVSAVVEETAVEEAEEGYYDGYA